MEELKNITNSTSITKISTTLYKIYEKIHESRGKNIAQSNIKEIDLLKNYCKSDNLKLCLVSCQTFVKLVEDCSLELKTILNFFITLLPNLNSGQSIIIIEGILNLLLLNLKHSVAQLKSDEKYECPYGIKDLQHPLITIIQRHEVNMINISNKITGICNHYDIKIKTHSIEFLRPVYLYIFCNPQIIPDTKVLWLNLLIRSKTSNDADNLVQEIITWSRINSQPTCLFTSILIIETIEYYNNSNNTKYTNELVVYLCVIVNHLIEYGIDPHPGLNCIYNALRKNHKTDYTESTSISIIKNQTLYNIILIILSKTVHIISPMNISDLFRIYELIIIEFKCGNKCILNMILDGTMQWIAQTTFIQPHSIQLAHKLLEHIIQINDHNGIMNSNDDENKEKNTEIDEKQEKETDKYENEIEKNLEIEKFDMNIRNLHTDIALAFDIAKLSENFDKSDFKNVFTFIDSFDIKTKSNFCNHIQLFMRALFLSKDLSLDCWFKIYEIILSIIKSDETVACDFLMTYIYKLTNETHPEIQMELLRGLPNFAIWKDCIPMILNILKTLSDGGLWTFCLDLYLRLWKIENRTYEFLQKVLSQNIPSWEFNVAKAYTIREICKLSPSRYGRDLVPFISDILNICSKECDDLATSITLDSITILCESNVINLVSTWKELSGKFRHEKRIRSTQSLFRFYTLFQPVSEKYIHLVDEVLDNFWKVVATSDNSKLIKAALKSLSYYDIEENMTLNHIPSKFKYDDVSSNDKIPGNVWVLLLQRIKPDCIEEAADLISHYLEEEISLYRSGIYHLPDGKPEPRKLLQLFDKSPLKAIIHFLIEEARYKEFNQTQATIITNALRSISKKFSKPIPPLDWTFLNSFFRISFLARKYCILIAKNQMKNSNSAKRLIENILTDFEPNIFEEDLLLIFSILPELANNVNLNVLNAFIDKIANYCYKESQLNGFQEGCLFEKFLDSVKYVFINKCESPETLNIFTLIAGKYMDSIDLDTRLFQKYTELVASLDSKTIDNLTSPLNWKEISIDKLKKSTLIRCYLILYNHDQDSCNPLNLLNPIIDAYTLNTSEQIFFFRHLSVTLYAFDNDKMQWAVEWIFGLFRQIQSLLIDSISDEKRDKLLFLLDIFVLNIALLSGCAILLGNLNIVATSRKLRMELFPESIQILCENTFWKNNEMRIYEFLYTMYKNPILPDDYSEMFKNAIICSRHKQYFDNINVWTKYVGMRK